MPTKRNKASALCVTNSFRQFVWKSENEGRSTFLPLSGSCNSLLFSSNGIKNIASVLSQQRIDQGSIAQPISSRKHHEPLFSTQHFEKRWIAQLYIKKDKSTLWVYLSCRLLTSSGGWDGIWCRVLMLSRENPLIAWVYFTPIYPCVSIPNFLVSQKLFTCA